MKHFIAFLLLVASSFGAQQPITIGTVGAGQGDNLPTAFGKVNHNFGELYDALDTKQDIDPDLTALAALSGTNTIYYRSASNTWTAVTIGSGLAFSSGTLSAPGGGSAAIGLSVMDYGAIGDGVANDSVAIAAAITAALTDTTTRTVYFPPGVYKCNITLTTRVQLVGAGSYADSGQVGIPATKLIPNNDALPVINVPVITNQRISGISIMGNGAGVSAKGISLGSATAYTGTQFAITDCEISKFTNGLFAMNVPSMRVDKVMFNLNQTGAYCHGGDGGPIDGSIFLNCDVSATGVSGTTKCFDLDTARGVNVIGGNFFDVTIIADLANASLATFTGINMENLYGVYAFQLNASSMTLTECNFQNALGSPPVLVRMLDYTCTLTVDNCGVSNLRTEPNYGSLPIVAECADTLCNPSIKLFRGQVGLVRYATATNFTTTRRYERTDKLLYRGTPKEFFIRDDFIRAGLAGQYGELGWTKTDIAGTSQECFQSDSSTNSPGQLMVRTSATSGDQIAFFLHSSVLFQQALFYADTVPVEFTWRGCPAFSHTSMKMRVGLPGVNTSITPDNGIFISYDTSLGDTNYMFECRNATSSTRTSSGVAATEDVFHTFRWRIMAAAGPVLFSVDDAPEVAISGGNLPTAVNLRGPAILMGNLTAAEKDVNTDFIQLSFRVNRGWN